MLKYLDKTKGEARDTPRRVIAAGYDVTASVRPFTIAVCETVHYADGSKYDGRRA